MIRELFYTVHKYTSDHRPQYSQYQHLEIKVWEKDTYNPAAVVLSWQGDAKPRTYEDPNVIIDFVWYGFSIKVETSSPTKFEAAMRVYKRLFRGQDESFSASPEQILDRLERRHGVQVVHDGRVGKPVPLSERAERDLFAYAEDTDRLSWKYSREFVLAYNEEDARQKLTVEFAKGTESYLKEFVNQERPVRRLSGEYPECKSARDIVKLERLY